MGQLMDVDRRIGQALADKSAPTVGPGYFVNVY
jgi:hypothetical protein